MCTDHTFFKHYKDGLSGVLTDPTTKTKWLYPISLLKGDMEGVRLIVPAGYPDFQRIWNLDHGCAYLFLIYEPCTGGITAMGCPIPIDKFAPEQSATQIETYQFLQLEHAESAQKKKAWEAKCHQEHQEARTQKELASTWRVSQRS
ncbi:hypothetical protein FOMPIDRAFT_113594 [Fomitopsis schrenkii]|uniref:Uncharacterized protein n=1 Tax=Fomitopsis schrenkii TaxID=2126942 RepID=S8EZI4_FOMSC|nr:hypothetical protein FOMPIDRAFT_113594 [Fomitopsis schrenkii]